MNPPIDPLGAANRDDGVASPFARAIRPIETWSLPRPGFMSVARSFA